MHPQQKIFYIRFIFGKKKFWFFHHPLLSFCWRYIKPRAFVPSGWSWEMENPLPSWWWFYTFGKWRYPKSMKDFFFCSSFSVSSIPSPPLIVYSSVITPRLRPENSLHPSLPLSLNLLSKAEKANNVDRSSGRVTIDNKRPSTTVPSTVQTTFKVGQTELKVLLRWKCLSIRNKEIGSKRNLHNIKKVFHCVRSCLYEVVHI